MKELQKLLPLHLFSSQRENKIRQEDGVKEPSYSCLREVKGSPTVITAVKATALDLSGRRKGSWRELITPHLQEEKQQKHYLIFWLY